MVKSLVRGDVRSSAHRAAPSVDDVHGKRRPCRSYGLHSLKLGETVQLRVNTSASEPGSSEYLSLGKVVHSSVGTMTCPAVLSMTLTCPDGASGRSDPIGFREGVGPSQLTPCGLGSSARKPWAPTQRPCLPQISEWPSASMEEGTSVWKDMRFVFIRRKTPGADPRTVPRLSC